MIGQRALGNSAMLRAEQNERITRVGPGTPAGNLMRRYWQPAALVEELEGERPIKALTLLGEDLVLFRDEEGRCTVFSNRPCCHRGADLTFGRLEDGGLRCPFHGWLFDVNGKCLEQPAEPAGSNFKNKVRQPSLSLRRQERGRLRVYGPGRSADLSGVRLVHGTGGLHLRLQGIHRLQLASGARGGPSIQPTPPSCTGSSRTRPMRIMACSSEAVSMATERR